MKIEIKDISDILIEAKKELEMSKEEFNKVWKDTSRKGILNQFYYDYMYMQKLKKDINKAIEYVKEHRYYAHTIDIDELLEILEGGEDNR